MQYFGFDRPSFGIKTFGFGANFDPLELFTGGKQGAWYDPSDKSTLFQDVAGTVPVTKDGDPVALMLDKSGNGHHSKQTLSASRVVYKTDGALSWLESDGVDDYIPVPTNAIIPTQSLSIISAFSVNSGSNYRILYAGANDKTASLVFNPNALVARANIFSANGKTVTAISQITTINAKSYIYSSLYNKNTRKLDLMIDGTLVGSATSNNFTSISVADTFSIFAYGTVLATAGKFFGMVLVNEDLIANNSVLTEYLATKAGVTL